MTRPLPFYARRRRRNPPEPVRCKASIEVAELRLFNGLMTLESIRRHTRQCELWNHDDEMVPHQTTDPDGRIILFPWT